MKKSAIIGLSVGLPLVVIVGVIVLVMYLPKHDDTDIYYACVQGTCKKVPADTPAVYKNDSTCANACPAPASDKYYACKSGICAEVPASTSGAYVNDDTCNKKCTSCLTQKCKTYGKATCNLKSGKCECDDGKTAYDPVKGCCAGVKCAKFAKCNTKTGDCECNDGSVYNPKGCAPGYSCSGQGECIAIAGGPFEKDACKCFTCAEKQPKDPPGTFCAGDDPDAPDNLSTTALVRQPRSNYGTGRRLATRAATCTYRGNLGIYTKETCPSPCAIPMSGVGGYLPNWAQYRSKPITSASLLPIIQHLDFVAFAFYLFDDNFELYNSEIESPLPGDCELQNLIAYKTINPNLQVILSVGGWSFEAHRWSDMASTKTNRAKFIASCVKYLDMGVDAIDIDWESPNMPRTEKYIQMSTCCCGREDCGDKDGGCQYVKCKEDEDEPNEGCCTVIDDGGSPNDFANLVFLVKEMKEAFTKGGKITIAGPAAVRSLNPATGWKLKEMAPYVDFWHVMNYDYWVSDVPDAITTQPNQPLENYSQSVRGTLEAYLNAGVSPSNIKMGLAYYGHSWWNPDLEKGGVWKHFGQPGKIQAKCCGPLEQTYGAAMGNIGHMCGSLLYNEIAEDLKDENIVSSYHDDATKSDIAFWHKDSDTSGMDAGTWLSYNGPTSMIEASQMAIDMKLAGVFSWDLSMDSEDWALTLAATLPYLSQKRDAT